ncbi:MAG: hypothetical protein AAFX58_13185, partial [Pseudomonadota bacterium]
DVSRPLEIFSCLKRNPFYCDEEATRLVSALAREMEPSERDRLLRRAAEVYRTNLPALFLVEQVDIFGASCAVAGLRVANRTPLYEQLLLRPDACRGDEKE